MNKFYTPILGTLAYVLSPDKQSVLMVHRHGREDDIHMGKYNGLGGKFERHEDVLASMKRELFEEAMITPTAIEFRGTLNWTSFGPKEEDWLGFIFLVTAFEGTPPKANVEGSLEWVSLDQMNHLPMWEGDRYFLPLVFDGDPRPFHGYMPYVEGRPASFSFSR